MRATEFIVELFDPKPISSLDPDLNLEQISATSSQWSWNFQIADALGKPTTYCVKVVNLANGYYMPDELSQCWMVSFFQGSCKKQMSMQQQIAAMGDLGNMGMNQAVQVFSVCGSLLKHVAEKTQAQGLVFNGVPDREKSYDLMSGVIQRATGWKMTKRSGSFVTDQRFYFFAANANTMKNMLRIFEDLGQID